MFAPTCIKGCRVIHKSQTSLFRIYHAAFEKIARQFNTATKKYASVNFNKLNFRV